MFSAAYSLSRRDARTTHGGGAGVRSFTPGRKIQVRREIIFSLRRQTGRIAPLILQIDPPEFLHALSGVDLGRVDVALAVDRDVVERREHADLPAGTAEACQHLLSGAPD